MDTRTIDSKGHRCRFATNPPYCQDLLALNSTHALQVVSDFIGLDPVDWSAVSLVSRNSVSGKPHEEVDELPMSDATKARLRAFYDARSSVYLSYAARHGYWGCRPAIKDRG